MKKLSKKTTAILLIAALGTTLFSGCGGNSGSTGSTGSTAASGSTGSTAASTSAGKPDKMVEISAMVFDRGNIPSEEGTVDDNRWTKWLNEKMAEKGIHVKFMPIPRSEEAQKIPVLMASGTAADIMMMYDKPTVEKFFTDGGTYELSEYIKNAPELMAYVGQECMDVGLIDGQQFAIPARRATTAQNNAMIRKDWLDKLGMAVPTTVDELYTALKAFKEKDPGGVGKDKVVAFNGGNILSRAFLTEMNFKDHLINMFNLEYTDPGMKEYWRFRNKVYNEGLMDPEYFTSTNFGQKEKELIVSGVMGFHEADVNYNVDNMRGGLLQNLKKNVPDAEFVSIVPIKNVNDDKVYNISYPVNGAFNFIPKTAKNPQACVDYLNFLAGEGGFTVFHGFENEHYTLMDGVPVVKDADYNAKTKDYIRHDLFLVGNQGYYKTEEEFMSATAKELPGWEKYVIENYTNAMEGVRLPNSIYSSPTQIEQSGNISKVNEDYRVKVNTCKPEEFDAMYDQWLKELEKYDIQKIVQERQEYYDKNYKE